MTKVSWANRLWCALIVGCLSMTFHVESGEAQTFVETDNSIVAVVDGPGGMGYWIVAADGSVEVVGTNIVPPLGTSEPITDKVRTAYELSLIHISEPTRPY